MFKNKVLLITGGTGSFGNAVLQRFINTDINEIRIFSRDEKKQDDMRRLYQNEKIKFFIGDVREGQSINQAIAGVDYVFHAAALKQVPSCEFYPMEAVRTNIIGTENLLNAALHNNVEKVICLSTDKAVYPINAMGVSKSLMEKVFVAKSRVSNKLKIIGTRYGNVMASRGSVIPLFYEQIKSGKPITITDPNMTRFMMTLDDAVNLVLFAFSNGKPGEIYVQKSPAATIEVLAEALKDIFNKPNHEIKNIGTRHGEKKYEVLLSKEEMCNAKDLNNYYCVPPDLRDLNYEKYLDQGNTDIQDFDEYSSDNTDRLDKETMKELLLKLDTILQISKGNLSATFEE